MKQQTAVDWFYNAIEKNTLINLSTLYEQAKAMEIERRKEEFKIAYNHGYLDAQCNHINDAENCANEQEYINDREINDFIIGPFGTPEKK